MKYLIDLKNDLLAQFPALTGDNTQLQIVNGELGKDTHTVNYIARFILLDCRLPSPFDVIGFIRIWFEGRSLDTPQLNFDCDVIDLETYDLQIDIALSDKLNIATDGTTTICYPLVWSEALSTFINGAIVQP